MWLTTTAIVLGTPINFLQPVSLQSDFKQPALYQNLDTQDLAIFSFAQYLGTDKISSNSSPSQKSGVTLNQSTYFNSPALERSNKTDRDLLFNPDETNQSTIATFKPGVAAWSTATNLGSLKFQGDFDAQANFKNGKAFWHTKTAIGSLDLAVNLNSKIKPIKSTASWQKNTKVGLLSIKGNLNQENQFSGGNATLESQTKVGLLSLNSKFDQRTQYKVVKKSALTLDTS